MTTTTIKATEAEPATTKTYFDGKTAEQITLALKTQAKKVTADIEAFGAMVIEAHGRQVHTELSMTWAEFCEQTLAGFKPDTLSRRLLAGMMRQAGLTYKDVADATGASERTVKSDAAKSGAVNANRQAGQSSRTDGKSGTTSAKPAGDALDDSKVVAYLRNMSDHAHIAALIRAAGYGTLLVPEYRHATKPVAVPAPNTPADAKRATEPTAKVRSVRRAGEHRKVIGTRPLASV
jgi:hypothetical protein